MGKLRKQVSVDFLTCTKNTINHLLSTKLPQSAKQKLCILIEKMLHDTKTYEGFKYLYWSKYGCLDWRDAKLRAVYKDVPKEFITGPDDDGKLEFISDIQGEYSRFYN
jgi:hypothetical protein